MYDYEKREEILMDIIQKEGYDNCKYKVAEIHLNKFYEIYNSLMLLKY